MSADNWTRCPQCKNDSVKRARMIGAAVRDAYGKLPEKEYLKLVEQAKIEPVLSDTLREDYEIGVDIDGLFMVTYSCSCEKCGFRFSNQYSVEAWKDAA